MLIALPAAFAVMATGLAGGVASAEAAPAAIAREVVAPMAVKQTPVDIPGHKNSRLVFAHYVPPYPISIDNQPASKDYYTKNFVTPSPSDPNEAAKHRGYGGLLRDRPIPSAPLAAGVDFELENAKTEVRQAMAAGIDGFAVCVMGDAKSDDQNNWRRAVKLMQAAAAVSPNFTIMLQPDMTTDLGRRSQADFVKDMTQLAAYPSVYKRGGTVVLSPFKADVKSTAWWAKVLSMLAAKKVKTSFIPLFLQAGPFIKANWNKIVAGYGDWGGRSPKSLGGYASQAHKAKKLWMQPVAVQDSRPNGSGFDEAANSETLRKSWDLAINNKADLVLLTTWNDYSETTSFAPSVQHGWAVLDISSYYIAKYRTGTAPKIVRDAVFLSNRVHAYSLAPSLKYPLVMKWNKVGTAPRNTIEVLMMLTKAATVRIMANGKTIKTYTAKAGVYAQNVPLQNGVISAALLNGAILTSRVTTTEPVVSTRPVQDLGYRFASSLR